MNRGKPFDLQTLYARVYEAEMRAEYGRMGRDLKEAKGWLELYPGFWLDEKAVETFQLAARNYIRSMDGFWKGQRYPMFGLLMQYNRWLPRKTREHKTTVLEWDTCNRCHRDYVRGREHQCERIRQ